MTMIKRTARSAFILPLTILALLSVAFVVMFVHFMSSGYSSQVVHYDEFVRCYTIANSAYAGVLAKIRDKPWSERFFVSKPFTLLREPLFDGEYDLYVENTPNKPVNSNQADIYIKAKYRRVQKLFFWRFQYDSSILDAAGKAYPSIFTLLDTKDFPVTKGNSPSQYIEQILITRAANKEAAADTAKMTQSLDQLKDVLSLANYSNDNTKNVPNASDPTVVSVVALTTLPTPPLPPPLPEGVVNLSKGILDPTGTGWNGGSSAGGTSTGTGTGTGTGTSSGTGTGTGTSTGTGNYSGTGTSTGTGGTSTFPAGAYINGSSSTSNGGTGTNFVFTLSDGTKVYITRSKSCTSQSSHAGVVDVTYSDGTKETFPN